MADNKYPRGYNPPERRRLSHWERDLDRYDKMILKFSEIAGKKITVTHDAFNSTLKDFTANVIADLIVDALKAYTRGDRARVEEDAYYFTLALAAHSILYRTPDQPIVPYDVNVDNILNAIQGGLRDLRVIMQETFGFTPALFEYLLYLAKKMYDRVYRILYSRLKAKGKSEEEAARYASRTSLSFVKSVLYRILTEPHQNLLSRDTIINDSCVKVAGERVCLLTPQDLTEASALFESIVRNDAKLIVDYLRLINDVKKLDSLLSYTSGVLASGKEPIYELVRFLDNPRVLDIGFADAYTAMLAHTITKDKLVRLKVLGLYKSVYSGTTAALAMKLATSDQDKAVARQYFEKCKGEYRTLIHSLAKKIATSPITHGIIHGDLPVKTAATMGLRV